MATFVGATINQPPGASGFALRALKTRKTYTTSWDITCSHRPENHIPGTGTGIS
jgi:hypothetical protein